MLSMQSLLERRSYTPLYVQLSDLLAQEIGSGRILIGQLLPSEAELSERYGISRITVRQAMARLVHERLVRRERGRGTFAIGGKVETQVSQVNRSFEEEMHNLRLPFRVRLLRYERMIPPPGVAATLQIPLGEEAYRLERLRLLRNQPFGIEIRYLPQMIGEKVPREHVRHGSVYTMIQEVLKGPVTRIQFVVSSLPASRSEARLLKTKIGAPLLVREHTYFASEDRPVLAGTVVFRGDLYRFRFEIGVDGFHLGSIFGDKSLPSSISSQPLGALLTE
jgi:GntR family transcriptional regulator